MEKQPSEPTEGEGSPEEAPSRDRRRLMKIVAIVLVVVIVGGAGGWYVLAYLGNSPPTALFSFSKQDLRLFVDASNSTDPDRNIASYSWDWGDQSPIGSGKTTFHDYATANTYQVTLTVTDARGGANSRSQSILVQALPTAMFVARAERMNVNFDATSSFIVGGGQITAYAWDFGDGQTGMGAKVSHGYAAPGRYTVGLTVSDNQGRTANTTRYVSPADTTVDILWDQFFESAGCPYENYWFLRYESYGDQVLRDQMPCTSYYPWVLFTDLPDVNPSFVYTIYRYNAKVRNAPGYSLQDPVVLPVLNPAAQPDAGSYVQLNLTLDYLTTDLINQLRSTPFAVNAKYSDGFGYLLRGTITLDLAMSRRIFGVVATTAAEARSWWSANSAFARNAGPAETGIASWLERIGNTKFDIYNGFEWFYETDITDLNATVADDGTTTVTVFWDGWGLDVVLARSWYWGTSNYSKAVNAPWPPNQPDTIPKGWAPMETCWCEKAKIDGRITSSLDLDLDAVSGYVFESWGNPGPDAQWGTQDDLASWVFEPTLMDYVPPKGSSSPGASGFPNSELKWWEGQTRIHGTPGSYAYGSRYSFLLAPTRLTMATGYSYTLILPRDSNNRPLSVPWYDPYNSRWNENTKIGDYVTFMAPMKLRLVNPSGDFYLWDARGKVLSFAGPFDWGTNTLPALGAPWIEFGPETAA